MIYYELGDEIHAFRKANGYTQETLAFKCGVNRIAVSNWERGRNLPAPWNIKRLIDLGAFTKSEVRQILVSTSHLPKNTTISEVRIQTSIKMASMIDKVFLLVCSWEMHGGDPVNRVVEFEKENDNGTSLIARVKRPRNTGFKFKCFVENVELDLNELRKLISDCGFCPDANYSYGKHKRIFFY